MQGTAPHQAAGLDRHGHALVPCVTWVNADVPAGTRHLALPSDLFALTVHCDDGFTCTGEGEDFAPDVTVTTLRTRPGHFISGGRGEVALVLLTPQAFLSMVRAPLLGTRDCRLPLERLCGADEQRRLRDRLRLARSPAERVERLGQWLEGRLTARFPVSDGQRRVGRATNLVLQAQEAPDLAAMASSLGVGRRQMERDFDRWLGVSPSHFIRLVRFQRAARSIAKGAPLVEVALEAGYADQPHLTRSVGGLAGMTPRDLRAASRNPASGAISTALADRMLIRATSGVTLAATPPGSPASHHRLLARAARHPSRAHEAMGCA